jgi:ABC-type iron transport system FetAB ATPase subunit
MVEKTLVEEVRAKTIKAIVWITHSEEQAARVGTRFLQLTPTGVHEENANGHGEL